MNGLLGLFQPYKWSYVTLLKTGKGALVLVAMEKII